MTKVKYEKNGNVKIVNADNTSVIDALEGMGWIKQATTKKPNKKKVKKNVYSEG